MAQITGVAEDRLQSGQLDSHDLSRVAAAYDLPATFFETETGSEIDQLRLLATLRATPAAALRLRGKPGR
ncbi:hypothetical protein [Williamsia sterculiae]|nr:hypothetical protein [Williamsia sterculiae]